MSKARHSPARRAHVGIAQSIPQVWYGGPVQYVWYLLSAEEPISALLLHHKRVIMKVKVQGRFQHSLRAGASGVAQKVGTHASNKVKLDLISVRAVLRVDG